MNERLTGLERHEGNDMRVINDKILIFGWTIPLSINTLGYFNKLRKTSINHQHCYNYQCIKIK